jgi:hypothetical protein
VKLNTLWKQLTISACLKSICNTFSVVMLRMKTFYHYSYSFQHSNLDTYWSFCVYSLSLVCSKVLLLEVRRRQWIFYRGLVHPWVQLRYRITLFAFNEKSAKVQVQVFCVVTPCDVTVRYQCFGWPWNNFALKMDAVNSSETFVCYHNVTRRHTEELYMNLHRRESRKSRRNF